MPSVRLPVLDQQATRSASVARQKFRQHFGFFTTPSVAYILGTGWGDRFRLDQECSINLRDLPGFEGLYEHPSHARRLCYGKHNGAWVLVLRGRIHLNDRSPLPEGSTRTDLFVRLMVDLLIELGAKTIVSTCAGGSLDDMSLRVGNVLLVNNFVTTHMPYWPAFSGEFRSVTEAVDPELNGRITKRVRDISTGQGRYTATYAFVQGPIFETLLDKKSLAHEGAHVVGMSMTPEAAVVALHEGVRWVGLTAVSNGEAEGHDDAEIQRRVKERADLLERILHAVHEEALAPPRT